MIKDFVVVETRAITVRVSSISDDEKDVIQEIKNHYYDGKFNDWLNDPCMQEDVEVYSCNQKKKTVDVTMIEDLQTNNFDIDEYQG